MKDKDGEHFVLPSAREDAKRARSTAETAQTRSSSYRLAFADEEFLLREELRPVRLQLELLKPELGLQEHGIESTIVVFGSARNKEPEEAERILEAARGAAASAPDDAGAQAELRKAERIVRHARYYAEARRFAQIVSRAGQDSDRRRAVIVTGGGPGIMEAANRGAADVGAVSIGHNITLPHEQAPNAYITPELAFQFHYFAIRKMHLMMRALALVVFPGGFGTLDELFECLCLIQTGKARPMPVLLFDRDYWERVIDFRTLVEEGVIGEKDLDLITPVQSADEAWNVIREHYAYTGLLPTPNDC
ncbi:MAG: TIGR00730 family Rossman fold protein [Geminicoccaceae bacterium]|nr:TIGR00730 family Rossman fold protein [Geminicoccaceae bacterium]